MDLSSWQLTDFSVQGQIDLAGKRGLVRIRRGEDGLLVLVEDANYGMIDAEVPTAISFAHSNAILGFVLDMGIRRERQLTYGSGFFSGDKPLNQQSPRMVTQSDFDAELFERIGSLVDSGYQSDDKATEAQAIRIQLLLNAYNDARLLFPNFFSESYLGLMRIVDALNPYSRIGAGGFATFAASVLSTLNRTIVDKMAAVGALAPRIAKATTLFDACMATAKRKKWACRDSMSSLDDAGRVVFACFYSAYQYRNTFVHRGFPFPGTPAESTGQGESGSAYVSGTVGISWMKTHRPGGLTPDDLIDIHAVLGPGDADRFRNDYFLLLPTWFFMKRLTRQALLAAIGDEASRNAV